jgi:hypothetical protein
MVNKQVKKYATASIPSKNRWRLSLEFEDGSKAGLQVASAADLAALCDILRHTSSAVYDENTGTLETNFDLISISAGDSRE